MTFSPACRPLVTVSCWPVPWADFDAAHFDLAGAVDHQHEGTALVDLDRLLRDQQRSLRLADLGDHGDELAVDEHAVGIGEHRAHLHRVRPLVDRHIDEIDLAGMRVAAVVGKPDVDDRVHRVRLPLLAELEHLALRDGKGDVDRVLPDDGRQRAGRGSDEVADRDRCPSDASRQGGPDFGIAELQLRLLQGSLLARQLTLRIALLGGLHVQALLRARLTRRPGWIAARPPRLQASAPPAPSECWH